MVMSVIVACLAVAAAEWRDNDYVDYYINTDDDAPLGRCDNTCSWSKDGVCDDARVEGPCELGTDCFDCGPIGASNFSTCDYCGACHDLCGSRRVDGRAP